MAKKKVKKKIMKTDARQSEAVKKFMIENPLFRGAIFEQGVGRFAVHHKDTGNLLHLVDYAQTLLDMFFRGVEEVDKRHTKCHENVVKRTKGKTK